MRNLASIVTIETKNKMYQKDRICVVTFKELGYEAIVPNDVKIGDRMVFIQEGSILPEVERWEFLRKRCYLESVHGFVIKPMIMGAKDANGEKGERVKSWGLCVTLTEAGLDENTSAGTDVTELLNIKKYEVEGEESPTASYTMPKIIKFLLNHKLTRWIGKRYLAKKKSSSTAFPVDIIQKSDETTIQNCKNIIRDFAGKKVYVTAKMEGQSFTTSLDVKTKKFYVCSRNNRFNASNSSSYAFYEASKLYDIEKKLKNYYKKTKVLLVIQGEQCGPGIQGNIYNLDNYKWFVYRMKGLERGKWVEYSYPRMQEIAKELGLDCVPLICVLEDIGKSFGLVTTTTVEKNEAGVDVEVTKYNTSEVINNLVHFAEKLYWKPNELVYCPKDNEKLWKDYLQHEGMVIKSYDYNKEEDTGFSFKVKNSEYAEKLYTDMHKIASNLK